MKKNIRVAVLALLALVFAASLGMMGYELLQYREGEEIYSEAQELVELPDFPDVRPVQPEPAASASASAAQEAPVYVDPYADALRNMDFSALREVNSEVLGWILIPDTVVSYPLLQHSDNSYYLKRTWKTWTSAVGSIFLECNSSGDFSDFNTIIYGHNMNNGSMFGSLKNYKKQSYWKRHPNVYITTDAGSFCYQIFAAYEVSTVGTTYQIGFSGDEAKQAFLDFCMDQSVIDTGVTPTVRDSILTLSTCTGRGHATRWVVQAVLKNTAAPDPEPEQTLPTEVPPPPPEQTAQEQEPAAPENAASGEIEDADGENGTEEAEEAVAPEGPPETPAEGEAPDPGPAGDQN